MALARSDVNHYVDRRDSPPSDVVRQYYAQAGSQPAKLKVLMWRKGPQTLLAGISGVREERLPAAQFWQKFPWFRLQPLAGVVVLALERVAWKPKSGGRSYRDTHVAAVST